jgi:hypothetical protein
MALMDDGWEERMAARAAERRKARGEIWWPRQDLAEQIAVLRAEQMAEHPERFSPEPPDDDTCRECCTWKIENRDMGRYTWWITCDFFKCTHSCHPEPPDQRVALATSSATR